MTRLRPVLATAALALGAACGAAQTGRVEKLADRTFKITCEAPLSTCLRKAEQLCKEGTYIVRSARDQRDRYGPELGNTQVEVRSSEAVFYCDSNPLFGPSGPPPAGQTAAPARPPPPPAPTAPATACVPGEARACVGPAGCQGGQACLPDGSGFAPCDCGTSGSNRAPAMPTAGTGGAAGATPTQPGGAAGTGGVRGSPR